MIQRNPIYSYDDWLNGKVFFGGAYSHDSREEAKEFRLRVPSVNFYSFSEEDESRIKKEQKRIFEKLVEEELQRRIDIFKLRYKKSREKLTLVKETLGSIYKALKSESGPIEFKHQGKLFDESEARIFRNYYKFSIVGGEEHYLFIQGPNSKETCFYSPPIQVYAEVFYNFSLWMVEEYKNLAVPKVKSDAGFKPGKLFQRMTIEEQYNRLDKLRLGLMNVSKPFVESSKPTFSNAFLGKEIRNKIVWTGTVSELSYFIKRIISKKVTEQEKDKWKVTIKCFKKPKSEFKISSLQHPGTKPTKARVHMLNSIIKAVFPKAK